jgi:adenylate cyclase class 2
VIEAELKARVRDPQRVRALLRERADEQTSRYRDTYYDLPGHVLTRAGRELRLRVEESAGQRRCLLTYKDAAVDEHSGSKPETQTEVADPAAMDAILLRLGYAHLVAFDKHCANYTFSAAGRNMLATVATVPELDGIFIEVETMTADESDLGAALTDIQAVLDGLGIAVTDLTSELYTDAVLQRRRTSPA